MSTKRKLPTWMLEMAGENKEKHSNNEPKKPILTYDGRINYCSHIGDCGMACEQIMLGLDKVEELAIGFDLEWPVGFKAGPGRTALIQLCTDDQNCHLFHVSEWRRLPVIFLNLIRHPKVRLVGLNIKNDLYKLGRDFDVSVNSTLENNTIELNGFANEYLRCRQHWSLERLVTHLLKKQLPKTPSVRMSNWSNYDLSEAQLRYAAADAYASLLLYQHLQKIKTGKHPVQHSLDKDLPSYEGLVAMGVTLLQYLLHTNQ